ncbi:uncharacterized protein LOC115116895 [Oncorhynchus nerka]|uniref:uncharacterized protein LOC115116895 n=1 Tax=Oncorhynchus nerka TaxID=8023 RepID=UPI0031B801FD
MSGPKLQKCYLLAVELATADANAGLEGTDRVSRLSHNDVTTTYPIDNQRHSSKDSVGQHGLPSTTNLPKRSSDNRTMREIAEDYESVISLLLQKLENNITESLKVSHKSCPGEMPECEKDNERQFIYNMMCSHTRLIRLFKLERLKREILCSLGRYCPRKQRSSQGQHTTHRHQRRKKKKPGGETVEEKERTEENRGTTEGGERLNSWKQQGRERKERSRSTEAMKRRRRQCRLKVFVDSLKECYMSLAERHGDLK